MSKIWWLWLPLAFIAVQMVLEFTLPAHVLAVMHSENSVHELLQFFCIGGAFFVALVTLFKMDIKAQKWLAAWVGLAAVCCLYVAGEEVSWGQHFLNWATPESWLAVNDQAETNLHNTSSWLDQKPRLLLEIGVLVGGFIVPALRKFRPAMLPARFLPVYPASFLFAIASILVAIKIVDEAAEMMNIIVFERVSEIQELYMFYFVLLYLVDLKGRLIKNPG